MIHYIQKTAETMMQKYYMINLFHVLMYNTYSKYLF